MAESIKVAAKWREVAERRCSEAGVRLTKARWALYTELVANNRPLSAYELIALREKRLGRKVAPLTVYRHLDFLIDVGLVHKIESTHTYVLCDHPAHGHESQYLLCTSCGRADELESETLKDVLSDMARQRGFETSKSVVEMSGICIDCSPSEPS